HQVAQTLLGIGHARGGQKNFDGAEQSYREALAIEQKAFGEEHQFVAEVLAHLARLYWLNGDSTNAQETLARALAMQEKTLRGDHPTTARSRAELTEFLKRTKSTGSSR